MFSKAFIQLLRIGMGLPATLDGESPVDFARLTEDEWTEIQKTAVNQAVIGLIYDGIMSLPDDQRPPRKIKVNLALLSDKIKSKNAALSEHVVQIYSAFRDMGIRTCLLKGQGIAALYPDPLRRQCGDIDLWVEGERKDTIKLLRSKWKVGEIWYHHADVMAFADKTSLEIHFYPSWMNSPANNALMQKYFASQADRQFSNFNQTLGYCVPTYEFNLVYCMIHLYRHLLLEGVGLRQVIDYYFILKSSETQERTAAAATLVELGIGEFVPSVLYVLKNLFGLEDEYCFASVDNIGGEFLLSEIVLSGNFGKRDSRNGWRHDQARAVKAMNRFRHLKRFRRYARSEVCWAPYFKLKQFLWKKLNAYR